MVMGAGNHAYFYFLQIPTKVDITASGGHKDICFAAVQHGKKGKYLI